MLKVHKFALLMVPNLSPYKFCPSRPYFMLRLTTLMVLNLQMRGRFRKRVSSDTTALNTVSTEVAIVNKELYSCRQLSYSLSIKSNTWI